MGKINFANEDEMVTYLIEVFLNPKKYLSNIEEVINQIKNIPDNGFVSYDFQKSNEYGQANHILNYKILFYIQSPYINHAPYFKLILALSKCLTP